MLYYSYKQLGVRYLPSPKGTPRSNQVFRDIASISAVLAKQFSLGKKNGTLIFYYYYKVARGENIKHRHPLL